MTTETKTRTFALTASRDDLFGAVQRVRNIVGKSTIPILGNLLLQAKGSDLRLTATNLDMEVVEALECSCEGEATVPADLLGGLLQKLPAGGEVSIVKDDDHRATLKCGRSSYKLPTLPHGDFPTIAAAKGELAGPFTLDTNALEGALEKTAFAASRIEGAFNIRGVYLHEAEGKIRCVATDGKVMACAEVADAPSLGAAAGVVIPSASVREIVRLLSFAGEETKLAFSPGMLRLGIRRIAFTTKLVDLEGSGWIDYERIFTAASAGAAAVQIERAVLSNSIARLQVIADDLAAIYFDLEPGKLTLSLRSAETGGEGAEVIECDYDGEPIRLGLNGRYVTDVLARIEGDAVNLRLGDKAKPVLFTDPSNPRVRFLVTSLKV